MPNLPGITSRKKKRMHLRTLNIRKWREVKIQRSQDEWKACQLDSYCMQQGSSPNVLFQRALFSAEGGLSSLAKPRDASESFSQQPGVTSPDSLAKASHAAEPDMGGEVMGQAWIILSLGRQQITGNHDPSTILATKTPLSCTHVGDYRWLPTVSFLPRRQRGFLFSSS